MRLSLGASARRDLDELHAYGVERYGEKAADTYLAVITTLLGQLLDWPFAFPLREEIRPPIRLRTCAAHNIFYDVVGDEVRIIRVLHHSIDWHSLL